MFKLTTEPTFKHTVTVVVPTDGGFEKQTLKATFLVIDVAEMGETSEISGQQALLKRILKDFADLQDDAGQDLPFSEALVDQMIAVPYVRLALFQAYVDAISRTKTGN